MNKIDQKLREIKQKKIGIMTHVVVGYPTLQATIELVKLMEQAGVDMIELQIPFSDPLADGPTIMKACQIALDNGTTVRDAFALVKQLQKDVRIPLLFMCYYNTVFRYGVEKFCKNAKEAGISGLIVPDMNLDEEQEEHFYMIAQKYNLHTIQVISPVATSERLEKISKAANGFVYATAHQGITGAKKDLSDVLDTYLQKVKKYIDIPLAVGFGISRTDHVRELIGKADIAVVGSKIIDIVTISKDYKKDVGDFLKQLNVLK